MTTAELIEALKKADPEGTTQVVVGNRPIYTVGNEPAYYDGCMQILVQDESRKPYFNIVGMKVTRAGRKVRLRLYDIEDWILDYPDGDVDLSDLENSDYQYERWSANIAEWRAEARQIEEEIAQGKAKKKTKG